MGLWRHLSYCNHGFPYFPHFSQYISTLFANSESCHERESSACCGFHVGLQQLLKFKEVIKDTKLRAMQVFVIIFWKVITCCNTCKG